MKKILIVLLTVLISTILVIPASADIVPESFFPGVWVSVAPNGNGNGESIFVLHLTDDHRAYFILQSIHDDDGSASGRAGVNTWSASGNRLTVKLGEYSKANLRVSDDGKTLYDTDLPAFVYYRAGDTAASQDGITLTQGRYLVGRDIPAGNYTFERIGTNDADVFIYRDETSSLWMDFINLTKARTTYNNYTLTDGQIVRVEFGPLLLVENK